MIMNALIGVYSDTYILHTIIQEELQKLTKILQKKTNFKDMNFPVKIRNILKVEKKKKKKTLLPLVCLVMKTKRNSQPTFQKIL